MKIKISFLLLFLLFFFSISFLLFSKTQAAGECDPGTPARVKGLITASTIDGSSKFYRDTTNTGCIVDNSTKIIFDIPEYSDWERDFFTKFPLKSDSQPPGWNFGAGDKLYRLLGDVTLNQDPAGSDTKVVFIKAGNLRISKDITYKENDGSGGLVFIVEGDINIDKNVDEISAVLISFGNICTAYQGSDCSSNINANPLVVKGGLISLQPEDADPAPIKFRRTLDDNTEPAEQVQFDPKYFNLLKHLLPEEQVISAEGDILGRIPNTLTPSLPADAPQPPIIPL